MLTSYQENYLESFGILLKIGIGFLRVLSGINGLGRLIQFQLIFPKVMGRTFLMTPLNSTIIAGDHFLNAAIGLAKLTKEG